LIYISKLILKQQFRFFVEQSPSPGTGFFCVKNPAFPIDDANEIKFNPKAKPESFLDGEGLAHKL